MPPKAKKGGKKKKVQAKIALDDIDTSVLNRVKLEEFCVNVHIELNKEMQNIELLRLERDKLITMIAVSREQLSSLRCKHVAIEQEILHEEENHKVAMTLKKQKMKHLKNEIEQSYLDKKLDSKVIFTDKANEQKEIAHEIICDINKLKIQINQLAINFQNNKIKIEKEHAENLSSLRNISEKDDFLTMIRHEKIKKENSTQLRMVLSGAYKLLVRLKEKEYRCLLDENNKRTTFLKYHYNGMLCRNQHIIQFMRGCMMREKDSRGQIDKQYLELKENNLKLSKCQKRLDEEKVVLESQLSSSKEHKIKLKNITTKLQKRKSLLNNLIVEQEVLKLANEKRNDVKLEEKIVLTKDFFTSMSRTQNILLLLEFQVIHIYNKLNEINATLSAVKTACKANSETTSVLLGSINEFNDTSMDSMNYEIAGVQEHRQKLFRAYKRTLEKFDVPFENTGFTPLKLEEIVDKAGRPTISVLINENSLLPTTISIDNFP